MILTQKIKKILTGAGDAVPLLYFASLPRRHALSQIACGNL